MKTTQIIDLQTFTRLPIRVVQIADKFLPDIFIRTPHKGDYIIKTKKEHYPFLFGSVTQTDVHANEILAQITKLEVEATDYLFAQWLKD